MTNQNTTWASSFKFPPQIELERRNEIVINICSAYWIAMFILNNLIVSSIEKRSFAHKSMRKRPKVNRARKRHTFRTEAFSIQTSCHSSRLHWKQEQHVCSYGATLNCYNTSFFHETPDFENFEIRPRLSMAKIQRIDVSWFF